jgi:hypothetical protein
MPLAHASLATVVRSYPPPTERYKHHCTPHTVSSTVACPDTSESQINKRDERSDEPGSRDRRAGVRVHTHSTTDRPKKRDQNPDFFRFFKFKPYFDQIERERRKTRVAPDLSSRMSSRTRRTQQDVLAKVTGSPQPSLAAGGRKSRAAVTAEPDVDGRERANSKRDRNEKDEEDEVESEGGIDDDDDDDDDEDEGDDEDEFALKRKSNTKKKAAPKPRAGAKRSAAAVATTTTSSKSDKENKAPVASSAVPSAATATTNKKHKSDSSPRRARKASAEGGPARDAGGPSSLFGKKDKFGPIHSGLNKFVVVIVLCLVW